MIRIKIQKHRVIVGALTLILGLTAVSKCVLHSNCASQADIQGAVERALAYLASNQDESGYFKEPTTGYVLASTALAVLAFENFGHFANNNSTDDPYATVVKKGLDYLLSRAQTMPIQAKPVGNPDANGNGQGAYWDTAAGGGHLPAYESPMAIMAIVASGTPEKTITSGSYANTTYRNLVADAVDWLAWAQAPIGGWRYDFQPSDSDNSVSQWPAIGLRAAEYWGVYAPAFVKSQLWQWIQSSQDLSESSTTYGGFGYTPGNFATNGVASTGAGICQLDYAGANSSNDHVQRALLHLNHVWETSDNMGFPYAMYAVMKGCRDATPPISTIGGHNWYNEYAEWLVSTQRPDGSWSARQNAPLLETEFAVLVLCKSLVFGHYSVTLVVSDEMGNVIENATLMLDTPDTTTISNSDGVSVFKDVTVGDHTFTASKAGYNSLSITRSISEDTVTTFTMETPEPYTVLVEVVDHTGAPVPSASISLGTHTGQTEASGKAVFANLTRGDYQINASKSGFNPVSVTQHVYRNVTITLALRPSSSFTPSIPSTWEWLVVLGIVMLVIANSVMGYLYARSRKAINSIRKGVKGYTPQIKLWIPTESWTQRATFADFRKLD
jgi:hypothetical protein